MSLPALRNIDLTPVVQGGETLLCLRDPLGLVQSQVILSPLAFLIASELDGQNGVTEIQLALTRHTGGALVPEDRIAEVVTFLDQQGFLFSPAFTAIQARVTGAYREASARPAALAGLVYPADADELRAAIDRYFLSENGPGELPGGAQDMEAVRCLIVPHIDYTRGGGAYAHGYLRLARGPKPETVLVFGVSHACPSAPFVLTAKDFETPFGTVPVDRERIGRLAASCGWDPYDEEIVHRSEHSIELQAVMLAYLYGSDVQMVPILCGGFACGGDSGVETFLEACRREVIESGGRVAVIASADLAHVGRAFGDGFEVEEGVVSDVRRRDESDLAYVLDVQPSAWYASVMDDDNRRRVCGLHCIYAALRSIEGAAGAGESLHYGYAPDPNGGIVSFSSIAIPIP